MQLKVRDSGRVVVIAVAIMALALSFACGKKSGAEKAAEAVQGLAQKAADAAPANVGAANDYMKPYLTDAKMTKFIESLQEDVNPFEVLFKGGQMMKMSDIEKRAEVLKSENIAAEHQLEEDLAVC